MLKSYEVAMRDSNFTLTGLLAEAAGVAKNGKAVHIWARMVAQLWFKEFFKGSLQAMFKQNKWTKDYFMALSEGVHAPFEARANKEKVENVYRSKGKKRKIEDIEDDNEILPVEAALSIVPQIPVLPVMGDDETEVELGEELGEVKEPVEEPSKKSEKQKMGSKKASAEPKDVDARPEKEDKSLKKKEDKLLKENQGLSDNGIPSVLKESNMEEQLPSPPGGATIMAYDSLEDPRALVTLLASHGREVPRSILPAKHCVKIAPQAKEHSNRCYRRVYSDNSDNGHGTQSFAVEPVQPAAMDELNTLSPSPTDNSLDSEQYHSSPSALSPDHTQASPAPIADSRHPNHGYNASTIGINSEIDEVQIAV
ncbi:hypothetical protein F5146DRAFT_1136171 [Armillaria mellea]|nr:hypothetical protein F5146DRAFT_1136171 [Armillaria mellea]